MILTDNALMCLPNVLRIDNMQWTERGLRYLTLLCTYCMHINTIILNER